MSIIYKITNNVNQKVYIGKTNTSIEQRFKTHCQDMTKREEEIRPLYRAMKKYGKECFSIEQIEWCSSEQATEREQYWIQYYQSYHNGYNATMGGDGKILYNHSAIVNRLKEHLYPKDLALEFGCCTDTIYNIAKHNNIKVCSKGSNNLPQPKNVSQYSMDGIFIQQFQSVSEAALWTYNQNICKSQLNSIRMHISECARGIRRTAYGFVWKY